VVVLVDIVDEGKYILTWLNYGKSFVCIQNGCMQFDLHYNVTDCFPQGIRTLEDVSMLVCWRSIIIIIIKHVLVKVTLS